MNILQQIQYDELIRQTAIDYKSVVESLSQTEINEMFSITNSVETDRKLVDESTPSKR